LEDYLPLGMAYFQGLLLFLGSVVSQNSRLSWVKTHSGTTAASFVPRCMGFVSRPGRHGCSSGVLGMLCRELEIKSAIKGFLTCGVLEAIQNGTYIIYYIHI